MDATTRLAEIEARCKALGWQWNEPRVGSATFEMHTPHITVYISESVIESIQAAERLLSCYEPGQVVTLSLTKNTNGHYTDQDGLSYDTPAEWLWIGILGGCGCGYAEEFGKRAIKLLKHFATPHMERHHSLWGNDFYELMAHWFDSLELIEHGSCITGSWLTEKGEQVYKLIPVEVDDE